MTGKWVWLISCVWEGRGGIEWLDRQSFRHMGNKRKGGGWKCIRGFSNLVDVEGEGE